MQPLLPRERELQWFKGNRGFWGLRASFDHGPNVELSPTKTHPCEPVSSLNSICEIANFELHRTTKMD
jgi:hypothetical protein